ncbi:thioredoxin reductase [Erysipelothrix larvae]|uniref:Thioredoxin reductase n=1 Tax=Erysipelothrix larvae TaxID=1514105 RepID=A0A0X8GY30_9FIRM|nr:thioredoxin-disulfide reductase [Erysipelothrix larvae]AMC92543.1 thioredoxin reductase [Erysipelothrix larvae]
MDVQYDVIIIGGGPAGMTAALYASRAGLNVAMMEREAPGGKMIKTDIICNYPGIDSINGADLSMKMYTHSTNYGAQYLYGDVKDIEVDGDVRVVVTEDGSRYTAKAVIAATGTVERTLGFPEDELLLGRGLSYCAVCDGAFFKQKNVIVIGGGNSALEEAVYLTQFADKVTIVIRRDVFRGDTHAQEELLKNPKIEVVRKHKPAAYILNDDGKISGMKFVHSDTNEPLEIKADGVFPYIGADPATGYLKNLGVLDSQGYIIADSRMHTSVPGVFAAGDALDKPLRQIVTATSDGSVAAQEAFHYIQTIAK